MNTDLEQIKIFLQNRYTQVSEELLNDISLLTRGKQMEIAHLYRYIFGESIQKYLNDNNS